MQIYSFDLTISNKSQRNYTRDLSYEKIHFRVTYVPQFVQPECVR